MSDALVEAYEYIALLERIIVKGTPEEIKHLREIIIEEEGDKKWLV